MIGLYVCAVKVMNFLMFGGVIRIFGGVVRSLV